MVTCFDKILMQGDNEALGQLYGVNDKIKKIQGECQIYRN